MVETIANEVEELNSNGVRLRSIGDETKLPKACKNELNAAKKETLKNDKLDLILALNYSARWEILNATQNIASKVEKGEIKSSDVDEKLFESELTLCEVPDPELLIRTSGEYRLSNFLLWQIAYAELYFTDKLWPDFEREDLFEAVLNYQNRERRFGLVSEQLVK